MQTGVELSTEFTRLFIKVLNVKPSEDTEFVTFVKGLATTDQAQVVKNVITKSLNNLTGSLSGSAGPNRQANFERCFSYYRVLQYILQNKKSLFLPLIQKEIPPIIAKHLEAFLKSGSKTDVHNILFSIIFLESYFEAPLADAIRPLTEKYVNLLEFGDLSGRGGQKKD